MRKHQISAPKRKNDSEKAGFKRAGGDADTRLLKTIHSRTHWKFIIAIP